MLIPLKILAVSSTPSSGGFTPSSTITINLTANPQGSEDSVSLRIQASGMTINSYTPPSGGAWLSIPTCSGGVYFNSGEICVDLAKSSAITAGESLGTLNVTFGNLSMATLVKTTGNGYTDGVTNRANTGSLASFTLITGSSGTLPVTGESKLDSKVVILIGGILVVSIVLIATYIFSKMRSKSV